MSCHVQLEASPVLGGSVRHEQAEEKSFHGEAPLAESQQTQIRRGDFQLDTRESFSPLTME